MRTGKFKNLYMRICRPSGIEYGNFLRAHGRFYSIGSDVFVTAGVNITDPAYVRIGNNCTLSVCTILGHDGSIQVLNKAYGKKLDSVGKVDIKDNTFIGHGVIILPNVTIGPNAVVAAGAVVSKDVPPGMVVGGVPAKVICTTESLVERLEERTKNYPWFDVIQQREGAYDPTLEPLLKKMRVEHFYGK
jgi:acetyltransferase-like isoleucine patch superfamily enzyme